MRVLIAKNARNEADCVCTSAREVKRVLNETLVNTLMIGYTLADRETGLGILQWAANKSRLPKEIILVEPNRNACRAMGEFLSKKGFKALTDRKFYHH